MWGVFQTYFDISSQYCLPKLKIGSHSAVFNLTSLVFGEKTDFHIKSLCHINPTSSPCCTARIATKLFPVHCHIINIKTLKYHFPTVCTWGVMQLLVNPIWSTILGLSPAQLRVKRNYRNNRTLYYSFIQIIKSE